MAAHSTRCFQSGIDFSCNAFDSDLLGHIRFAPAAENGGDNGSSIPDIGYLLFREPRHARASSISMVSFEALKHTSMKHPPHLIYLVLTAIY